MNVYDFDKTIYRGDSSIDFYRYCLRKQPKILLCLPRQIWGVLLHAARRIHTTAMKERFFSFLGRLERPESLVLDFWEQNQNKIKPWYWQKKSKTDVIVSASPEFLLQPICASLGLPEPISTRMALNTGRIEGRNCKGKEKVRRFREQYPDLEIDQFYSDSKTDAPLAKIARESFLVKGNRLKIWTVQTLQRNDTPHGEGESSCL